VLLRGVNDDAAALEALMRGFVECRIKPYYLHHGDLAPGTAHLRTTIAHGQALMRDLRGRVSGLCQPDYVLDIPGGHGKAPVGPNYLSHANSQERELSSETRYRIVDYCGDVHLYPPEPWSTDDGGRRGKAGAAGRRGQSRDRKRRDARLLCGAGSGWYLAARDHGRFTEGAGLRRAGAA
jgi:hypothetical protein